MTVYIHGFANCANSNKIKKDYFGDVVAFNLLPSPLEVIKKLTPSSKPEKSFNRQLF